MRALRPSERRPSREARGLGGPGRLVAQVRGQGHLDLTVKTEKIDIYCGIFITFIKPEY